MKRLFLALLLLNFMNVLNFAQGEGVLPSLTMQRSLPLIGAGNIGAAKANNDPIGYYLNPAILGYTSQNNHASLFFMPTEMKFRGIPTSTFGFNVGYNLKDFSIPISVGFGYMNDIINYETYTASIYDSFKNFSFGVGIDYYVLLNFGVSIKSYKSSLGPYGGRGQAKGTAFDYGAMIIAPISKLLFNDMKINISDISTIKPTVNFTIGYSLTNVGDEVVYFDKVQSDPLSRTGRLGYTLDFGFDTFINENKVNLITYSFTAEVEDILIEKNEENQFVGYQSFLGDINIGRNLIQLEEDEKVRVRIGNTINIFETITFTFGFFAKRGNIDEHYQSNKTKGIGFSSEGILKLWSYSANNSTLSYIAKHFILEYFSVAKYTGSWAETDMSGFSLHMKNVEL